MRYQARCSAQRRLTALGVALSSFWHVYIFHKHAGPVRRRTMLNAGVTLPAKPFASPAQHMSSSSTLSIDAECYKQRWLNIWTLPSSLLGAR